MHSNPKTLRYLLFFLGIYSVKCLNAYCALVIDLALNVFISSSIYSDFSVKRRQRDTIVHGGRVESPMYIPEFTFRTPSPLIRLYLRQPPRSRVCRKLRKNRRINMWLGGNMNEYCNNKKLILKSWNINSSA